MNLIKENRIWMRNYLRQSKAKESSNLRQQEEELREYVDAVLGGLRRRKSKEAKECIEFIEKKIIPYLERMKWLPDSYLDILDNFESGKFEKEV